MQIELSATKRAAQGTGASRRLRHAGKVPGILYGGAEPPLTIELDHDELYLQAAARGVPRVDHHAHPRRPEAAGAAAGDQHASLEGAGAAHRLPARARGPEDPREGPAALPECRAVAGGEGGGRGHQPRDERHRDLVPAGGSPGVHRGRSVEDHRRALDPREGARLPAGRHAGPPSRRGPGGRVRVAAEGGADRGGRGGAAAEAVPASQVPAAKQAPETPDAAAAGAAPAKPEKGEKPAKAEKGDKK